MSDLSTCERLVRAQKRELTTYPSRKEAET